MTSTIRLTPAIVLLLSWVWLTPALATNNDAEKDTLARLIHELDAVNPLIQEASGKALGDTRIRFNYTWLKQDLERIKSGIREYLETPSTEPRTFPPLQGDYRQ